MIKFTAKFLEALKTVSANAAIKTAKSKAMRPRLAKKAA